MNITLKDFQEEAVFELCRHARAARRDVDEGDNQVIILAAPTGSGKTVVANAMFERILVGDETHEGDPNATFLWLTDQPKLNEQTRRKFLANSTPSVFDATRLVSIEWGFDERRFAPGHVYFLNTQKIGKDKRLVTPGDRNNTLWETISRTVEESPSSFWLVIDEAHRGMTPDDDPELARTIAQKFIVGSPGEIPATPLVVGISATPQRFQALLSGKPRTQRQYLVTPDRVRDSGLIKEWLTVYHPDDAQPSDWTLLGAATEKLTEYAHAWDAYCSQEEERRLVEPLLVLQVENAPASGGISSTNVAEAIRVVENSLGRPLGDNEIAHTLQEGTALEFGDRLVPYVDPSDIEDRSDIRVVFFKMSLNTGWDCPRAEVMMSFRRAIDHTHIAQLVGRMVRNPLAHRISTDQRLNTVSLYLPHYDRASLRGVIDYLQSPDPAVGLPSMVRRGEDLVEVRRDPQIGSVFDFATELPTYSVERVSRASGYRRLARLGRYLSQDGLNESADATLRGYVVSELGKQRERLEGTSAFKQEVAQAAQISVRVVDVALGRGQQSSPQVEPVSGESEDSELIHLDVAQQNLDDIFETCGRQLGEGLHVDYVKDRVGTTGWPLFRAKLELFAVLRHADTLSLLEATCSEEFTRQYEQWRHAISQLPDGRRQVYRRLIRTARRPEAEALDLPQNMLVDKCDQRFDRHLYVDADGAYPCELNSWEKLVLEDSLNDPSVVAWLRNIPRQDWSLVIPYRRAGEDRAMYPDFLVFRRVGDDNIVADILEPHSTAYEDSWRKAIGLAEYAKDHGEKHFGRIEIITKVSAEMKRLDVNRPDIRADVLGLQNNQDLLRLFGTA